MNISLKSLIFCLAIASMSLVVPHAAQAQNLADSVNKAANNMDISFEPKKPGSCTGDKCAAGGSY